MNRWLENKYVVICLSLILGFSLAGYVYSRNQSLTTNTNSIVSATTTKHIHNVPIHIIDSSHSKYVSGVPETIAVIVEGPRNLLVQLNENTLYVDTEDIAHLSSGANTIILKVVGLPSSVTATILPEKVNAQIGEIVKKEVSVEPLVDDSIVTQGYEKGIVTVSPTTIILTGSKETIEKVNSVTATVSVPNTKTETFTQNNIAVVVRDADNNILDVSVDKKVSITIPIYKKGQTVPVEVTMAGQKENYTYIIEEQTVKTLTLLGSSDSLRDVSKITATVNVSELEETSTLEATVLVPIGVTISNPQPIKVTVNVAKNN